MSRLLLALIALGALGYLAYWALYNRTPGDDVQAPTQQLENVHQAADRIEQQEQQKVDDLLEKTKGE